MKSLTEHLRNQDGLNYYTINKAVEAWLTEFSTDYKGTVGFCDSFVRILKSKMGKEQK